MEDADIFMILKKKDEVRTSGLSHISNDTCILFSGFSSRTSVSVLSRHWEDAGNSTSEVLMPMQPQPTPPTNRSFAFLFLSRFSCDFHRCAGINQFQGEIFSLLYVFFRSYFGKISVDPVSMFHEATNSLKLSVWEFY